MENWAVFVAREFPDADPIIFLFIQVSFLCAKFLQTAPFALDQFHTANKMFLQFVLHIEYFVTRIY